MTHAEHIVKKARSVSKSLTAKIAEDFVGVGHDVLLDDLRGSKKLVDCESRCVHV
jgi:hypothetical protein